MSGSRPAELHWLTRIGLLVARWRADEVLARHNNKSLLTRRADEILRELEMRRLLDEGRY